jgi:hypothetical protein
MERVGNGELMCTAGDMGLARNLEKILLDRFGAHVKVSASAPTTGGDWFCPACRIGLDPEMSCTACGGTLKDLHRDLVEIHPHLDWPRARGSKALPTNA